LTLALNVNLTIAARVGASVMFSADPGARERHVLS
jgi:hypothetical protein